MLKIDHHILNSYAKIRFGESTDVAAIAQLRKYFKQLDTENNRIQHLSANEKTPETDISLNQKRIKKGMLSLMAVSFLALTGFGGFIAKKDYNSRKPSEMTVKQNRVLKPDWEALTKKIRDITGRGKENEPESKAEFIDAFRGALIRTVMTLAEYPNDKLDSELLYNLKRDIEQNPDYMPLKTTRKIGDQLIRHITVNHINSNSSDKELETSLQKFVSEQSDLKKLRSGQKAELINDFKEVIKRESQLYPEFFVEAIIKQTAKDIPGVSLEEFKNITTKKDAIRLFQAFANNSENLSFLNENQRKTFVKEGSLLLESLEYYVPSPMYGFAAYLLIAFGIAGVPATVLLRRKEMLGLSEAKRELAKALENPVMFIINTDQADVTSRSRLAELNTEIDQKTALMEQAVQKVFQQNDESREFMLKLFGSEHKLPKADWFRKRFTYDVLTELLNRISMQDKKEQKPVGELAFLEPLYTEVETACYTGEFLKVSGLDKEDTTIHSKTLSNREMFKAKLQHIENLIAAARTIYVNHLFGQALAEILVEKEQRKTDAKKNDFIEKGSKFTKDQTDKQLGEEFTEAKTKLDTAKKDLDLVAYQLNNAKYLANAAKTIMDKYIAPLKEASNKIIEAINKEHFNTSVEELLQIKDASGNASQNSHLKELIESDKLESFLKKELSRTSKLRKSVKTRIKNGTN